jgi:hypothetical protein
MLENRYAETIIIPQSYLGYANNPRYAYGVNRHNSHGFRGEDILVSKPDSVFRIVCLGGSITYCLGVKDYKHSYPYLLEETLNKKGLAVEVFNGGAEGYNSLQSYMNYLIKVEALEPDMLIVYHAINDI